MKEKYAEMVKRITPEMRTHAKQYVQAENDASVLRKKVDAVWFELLQEDRFAMYRDKFEGKDKHFGERILSHEDLYLSKDDITFNDAIREMDKRLKERGIKPLDMPFDYCPALVAESNLTDMRWILVADSEKILGIEKGELSNFYSLGLEKAERFFSLHCGLCEIATK